MIHFVLKYTGNFREEKGLRMARAKVKKEPSKASKLFWRVFISLVGIALIGIAVNDVALGIVGKTAVATVSVRRVGGSDDGYAPANQYTWSIDYTFNANGKEYSGHTQHRGSAIGVDYDREVHYYAFAPWINSLDADPVPGLKTLVYVGLGVLLLVVMNRPKKKTAKAPQGKGKSPKIPIPADDWLQKGLQECGGDRITMAWLMENTTDYDDRVELYYQNGWDKGDPSWQCPCGKWNDKAFCSNCGQPRNPTTGR